MADHDCGHISIPDGNVEFVTSFLVVSQFDHEPYNYLTSQAAEMIGPPTQREERVMHDSMELLRSILLGSQVERHCREIRRILAPGRCCYMVFELFHVVPAGKHWFLVDGASRTLDVIARHFHFDFDMIPEDRLETRFQSSDTPSLVCSFVLQPKDSQESVRGMKRSSVYENSDQQPDLS